MQIAAKVGARAQQQLAGFAGGQRLAVHIDHLDFHAGQRAAVGVERALVVVFQPGQRDGAVFGHAPGRDNLCAQRLSGLFHQRARDGRAGAQKGAQAGHGHAGFGDGAGQIGEERRGGHGETGLFRIDERNGLAGLPHILQHRAGLQQDGHDEPIHEAGLVRHGRGHQDHVVGTQVQALGIRHDIGHHRVGRVHHALGLARGARGVDELGHIVWAGAVRRENGLGIGLLFPFGVTEQGVKAVGAAAADHHHMFQVRQTGLQRGDHLLKVKTPEALGRNHHLGLAMLQHE